MRISGTLHTLRRPRFAAGASVLALSMAAANAQSVTPTVDYPTSNVTQATLVEERGLDLPVPPLPDISSLNIQEAAQIAAQRQAYVEQQPGCANVGPVWTASGATVDNVATPAMAGTCLALSSGIPYLDPAIAERRIFETVVGLLIDNTNGDPGQIQLRGVGPSISGAIEVTASDLSAARRALLEEARSTGGRFFAGDAVLTGGGPFVTSDRILSQRLTGRDTYTFLTETIGGNTEFIIIGTRINCPSATSTIGCQGGVIAEAPGFGGGTFVVSNTITTLYITNTVERTLTGGTSFYDVTLTPLPNGTAHAAAQTVGLALGDRFLRRLTTPGAAGFGQPLGPKGDAARWRVFLEGAGANGDLTGNGRYYFRALRGGISRMVNQNFDLGLAFEAGNWSYKHPDTFIPERAEGDLWRLGAFARYTPGPWRLHGAVIGGEQDVETTGISLAGGGTSRAKARATILGAGLEAGYAIPVDGFTLTPHARVNALRWSSPATAETGGLAPLSLRKATREQVRLALGATLGKSYEIEPGLDLGVEIGARAFTTMGDVKSRVVASDSVNPAPLTIDGPATGRSGVELTAGLTLVKDGRMAIAASYEGRFASDEHSHAGMLTLKMTF